MPMVKFTPSPEQREVVAALSASKMPLEKIAASIINPRTKRAISPKTLRRMFKDQLDAGVGVIVEAFRGLKAAIAAQEPWAIRYALDHVGEFEARKKEVTTPQAVKNEMMQINVIPVRSPHTRELIDEPVPVGMFNPPRNLTLVPALPEPPKPAPAENKFAFQREEPAPEEPPARTELDQGLRPGWHMDVPPTPKKGHWMG
jgi:hypothetical protein